MIRAPLQVHSCGKRTPGLRKALQTSSSQLRNMHDLARPAPQRRSFGRSADRHSRLRKRCVVVCAPSAALGRAEWPASAASGTDADAGDDGRRTRSGATAPGRLARCRCAGRRRRRAAGPLLATTSGGYGAAWCSVFTVRRMSAAGAPVIRSDGICDTPLLARVRPTFFRSAGRVPPRAGQTDT